MKDQVFYEESDGDVTLSGGEVLSQADFAIQLLKELKALQLHTEDLQEHQRLFERAGIQCSVQ